MVDVSPGRPAQRFRARSHVLACIAWTIALALLALPDAAAGHDELLGSSPSNGEVASSAPTTVLMIFSAELTAGGAAISVTGSDGTEWAAGPAVVSGFEVSAKLDEGMPNGTYEVRWRVVSADAHPISGVFTFSIAPPADQSATPGEPARESAPTTPASNDRDLPARDEGRRDADPVIFPFGIAAVTAVVIALALIGLLVVRRRSIRR